MLRSIVQSATRTPRARLPPCTCGAVAAAVAPLRALSTSSPAFASSAAQQSRQGTEQLPKPASKYTLPLGLELKGTVVAAGRMAHTVSVSVERRMTDHKTLKEFSRHTKFLVHDPDQECVVGDQVLIRNCRPVSARKRFELVQVTKGARERVESHHAPQGGQQPASASTPSTSA